MQFQRGYLSQYMITDQEKMEAVLKDCYVLVTDKTISSVQSILPIDQISKINYAVQINGINAYPSAGTLLIYGDPESYFITNASYISVVQG